MVAIATVPLFLRIDPALKKRIEDKAGSNDPDRPWAKSTMQKVAVAALNEAFPDPDAPPPRQLDMFSSTKKRKRASTKKRPAAKKRATKAPKKRRSK